MNFFIRKSFAVLLVVACMLGGSIIVSATNEYNVNEDYNLYGSEVIDICDLVGAEYLDKGDSFILKLQRIILEVEELPVQNSAPTNRGGIYLPEIP